MQHDPVQRMHHHRDQSPQLGGAVQRDGTDPVEIQSGAPETQSRSPAPDRDSSQLGEDEDMRDVSDPQHTAQ